MADPDNTTASASEPTYFVSLFDPTGVMMTAQKIGEHLNEEQAIALRDQVSARGGMALIYQERPDQIDPRTSEGPLEADPADRRPLGRPAPDDALKFEP